ncbi:hypothetical protein A9267_02835 [Shewanella sp. UCD-FRSSP16_17]|uniref:SMP-30/gluconolactonase/LRE family protein n=1 Tax=unclassified Shewanella TaxID=196818 RepID=UPI0007EEDC80|nr:MULTISPECIES: SMP-30/gluconolactonase/LRE family protein [unclassified Shewanella]MBQ4891635.1 SMP-30/gluconolactonase/LRE family protein [Shewanella sp. MMG014]OBT11586.1 hypothetical protein A9267_02835 [Shewanella sp. UCD-FRSSP16_17]
MSKLFDARINYVGESPLWHPLTQTLYWVDFPNKLIRGKSATQTVEYQLAEMATAIGWIDEAHLLIATETGLYQFHLLTQKTVLIINVEHTLTTNRSNDGRADPWGGFWIGTMDNEATLNKGSFYRYYQGDLTQYISELTIPNGMCFDKSRCRAYYADSQSQKMFSLELDPENGAPLAGVKPTLFADFSSTKFSPDGAVVDASGNVWIALWDGACVVCISPSGEELSRIDVGTLRPTCPGFGGANAHQLYTTTAQCGLEQEPVLPHEHGTTLLVSEQIKGVYEPAVIIA